MRSISIDICNGVKLQPCSRRAEVCPIKRLSRIKLRSVGERRPRDFKEGIKALGLREGQGGTDATAAASEIVIVWPIKSHGLDKQQSENFALAEGQMDAIEQASVEGQCSIRFQRQPAN